eukprot:jgi/Psemu1/41435/gm1.41435_g
MSSHICDRHYRHSNKYTAQYQPLSSHQQTRATSTVHHHINNIKALTHYHLIAIVTFQPSTVSQLSQSSHHLHRHHHIMTTIQGIENLMNPIYGLNINFINILFADGSNLHDSITMISCLKEQLLDNICINSFNTPDTAKIALLTNHFTLMVPFDNIKRSKPMHIINNLECAIHIFINMSITPISIHNFDLFAILTSFPKPTTQPPAIPTVPNPAAAATAKTGNPLNQQFLALFNQQANILQHQSKLLTSLPYP